MNANIFIMGFMGVGKSRFGNALAERLNCPYLDTDLEFAKLHNGMSTGDYIRTHELLDFRLEEQRTLRITAENNHKSVIATGGGTPIYQGNRDIIRNSGIAIHIQVPLAVITARMSPEELAKRPLWAEKTPEEIEALLQSRLPIYNSAEYLLNGNQPTEQMVQDFLEMAAPWLKLHFR